MCSCSVQGSWFQKCKQNQQSLPKRRTYPRKNHFPKLARESELRGRRGGAGGWGLGCRANWRVFLACLLFGSRIYSMWETVTFSHWSLAMEETLSGEKLRHFSSWLSGRQGAWWRDWCASLTGPLPFSCLLVLLTSPFRVSPCRGKFWNVPTQSFELELASRWRFSTENGSGWRRLGPTFLRDIHYIRRFMGIGLLALHKRGETWPLSRSGYNLEEITGGRGPQKRLAPSSITQV